MSEPNLEYINQSLLNQITNLSMQLAHRDSLIAEQQQKLEDLEVKQMNGDE